MSSPETGQVVNPYQPPTDVDGQLDPNQLTVPLNSIAFQGIANKSDVLEFLKRYDGINWSTAVTGFIFLSLLLLWALMAVGIFLALVVAGGTVLAMTAAITSSRAYRAGVFQSANPRWDQPVSGTLGAAGISLDRGDDSCFYRWNWFGGVVIAERMVAFIPTLKSDAPILVTQSMLPASVTLDDLKHFARSAKVICEKQADLMGADWALRQVMKSPDRERQSDVPHDAISFEGAITGGDFNRLPQFIRRPGRPARAHLVRASILLGIGCIAFGAMLMLGFAGIGLIEMLVLMTCAVVFGSILRRYDRRHRSTSDNQVLFYLVAHASQDQIMTDYFVSVTWTAWNNMTMIDQLPNRIVLGQKHSRRVLIARDDMFSSPEDWQTFQNMVTTQAAKRTGDSGMSSDLFQ